MCNSCSWNLDDYHFVLSEGQVHALIWGALENFCRHASRYTIGLLIFVGDCSLRKSNLLYNTMLNYSINIFEGFQNPNVTVDSFTLINTNMQNEFPLILLSILELGHIHINFYHPPFIVCLARKATPTSFLSSSKKNSFLDGKKCCFSEGSPDSLS